VGYVMIKKSFGWGFWVGLTGFAMYVLIAVWLPVHEMSASCASLYQQVGRAVVNGLNRQDSMPTASIDNAVGLIWYLEKLALAKGLSVREGMYLIEDPQNRVLEWLKEVPGVYERYSSHFPGSRNKQFGLDISGDSAECDERLTLPHGNRHLLFGAVDDQFTFIEPQLHGIKKWRDWVRHGISFVRYRYRNLLKPRLLESTGYHHEAVPTTVKNAWQQLQRVLPVCSDSRKQLYIKDMVACVDDMEAAQAPLNEEQEAAVQMFKNTVKDYDYPTDRFGREVILTRDELRE
jgi:hypothetical protein